MNTLRELLQELQRRRVALGHFNVSDMVSLKAVTGAARGLNLPVLVGVSEGERDFMGVRETASLVATIRNEYGMPIFLNADHTHTLPKAEEAAKAGFDMVVFDASGLSFDDNVRQTRRAVEALKSINPSMVVEGEIGYIGTGSEIHDKAPDSLTLTTAEEAKQFVDATRVDVLAPAVGNMHGMLKSMASGGVKKRLNVERIAEIRASTGVPMTLHGGSGTDDDDFRKAITAGITVIHINTELRLAWRRGLESAFAKQPDEIVPYKLLQEPLRAIENIVRARLQLFSAGAVSGSAG